MATIKAQGGFTLVELMIVIAIIGILAAIALPQMGNAIRSSQEACTKGNLGTLRSALSIYYADNDGTPLQDLNALTVGGRYLTGIPLAYYPTHHVPNRSFGAGDTNAFLASFEEDAAWWLFTDAGHENQIMANCIHKDLKGATWTSY